VLTNLLVTNRLRPEDNFGKLFCDRNLRIFLISLSVCPWQLASIPGLALQRCPLSGIGEIRLSDSEVPCNMNIRILWSLPEVEHQVFPSRVVSKGLTL
jgi:hypothetical protein